MTFGDRMAFPRVELLRNADGEYVFRILNRHGAVIANSVGFDSKVRMRGALRTVLQMAPWAQVDDLSKEQPAAQAAAKASPVAKKDAPAKKEAASTAKKAAPAKKSASKRAPARPSPEGEQA
jgi:uncharacterized protein YegP (UPF0339 family)